MVVTHLFGGCSIGSNPITPTEGFIVIIKHFVSLNSHCGFKIVLDFDLFLGNSREIIAPFYIINKVGYLHRQPTSDVLSNQIITKSNIVITK